MSKSKALNTLETDDIINCVKLYEIDLFLFISFVGLWAQFYLFFLMLDLGPEQKTKDKRHLKFFLCQVHRSPALSDMVYYGLVSHWPPFRDNIPMLILSTLIVFACQMENNHLNGCFLCVVH